MGHPINKKIYQGVNGPVYSISVSVYSQKHKTIIIVDKRDEKKNSVNGPVDCNPLKLNSTFLFQFSNKIE